MNVDVKHSETSSGTTSATQPVARPRSEAAFYAAESNVTRAALQRTADDLRGSIKTAADVRLWTREYPWAAVGAAAAAGCLAAFAVVPGRSKGAAADSSTPEQPRPAKAAPSESLVGSLLKQVVGGALHAVISAATQPQESPHAHEGGPQEADGFPRHNGREDPEHADQ